jgi:hypothetical protein
MTYQETAQQALDVQDACNLSGVVHAFSRAMTVIWSEADKQHKGTEWVNTHPIVTLFIDKLASLNRYDSTLNEAWDSVTKIAHEGSK